MTAFTIATRPHRRRRRNGSLNRKFLTSRGRITVAGVDLVGGGYHWHIDATRIGIGYDDHARAWTVEGPGFDWFYALDPGHAVECLRHDGHLPKAEVA